MGQGNLEAVIKVLKDVGSGVVQLLSLSILGSGGECHSNKASSSYPDCLHHRHDIPRQSLFPKAKLREKHFVGFPGGASGKESACQCRRHKRHGFNPWVGKIPWRRARQPTPVFLPGESHGQRSLVGNSPQGHKESDITEATQPTGTEVPSTTHISPIVKVPTMLTYFPLNLEVSVSLGFHDHICIRQPITRNYPAKGKFSSL